MLYTFLSPVSVLCPLGHPVLECNLEKASDLCQLVIATKAKKDGQYQGRKEYGIPLNSLFSIARLQRDGLCPAKALVIITKRSHCLPAGQRGSCHGINSHLSFCRVKVWQPQVCRRVWRKESKTEDRWESAGCITNGGACLYFPATVRAELCYCVRLFSAQRINP